MATADRGEWLRCLEAELARRNARVEWEAGEAERAAEQFFAELEQMAARFARTAHLYPLPVDDMSPAEMLACRYFLPEDLQPEGLGSEDEIFALVAARRRSG